jgi:hypothetical protein
VFAIRYVIPAVLFAGGLILLAIEPNATGLEGFAMATGAALSVLLLNWLFREGVRGDETRRREEDAREQFAKTGRWPDD